MPKHWRPARAAISRPLGAAYVESTRPRTGHTPRFIDKMPLNFFYAPLIHRALPHAKIICLRRNPLDTCLSNYRQLFATSFSYYNYAYDLLDTGRYYAAFDALTAHWRATPTEELPRGSLRGRRRPHRARSAPARRVLRAALGSRGASPSRTTPRPSRRRAPCRSVNRSTVRASSGGGTTSASLRRCAHCSPTPACCEPFARLPAVAPVNSSFTLNADSSSLVTLEPASVWRRLAAFCYDLLLVAALVFCFTLVVLAARLGAPVPPGSWWFPLCLVGDRDGVLLRLLGARRPNRRHARVAHSRRRATTAARSTWRRAAARFVRGARRRVCRPASDCGGASSTAAGAAGTTAGRARESCGPSRRAKR